MVFPAALLFSALPAVSGGVRLYKLRPRQIQGAPCGTKKMRLIFIGFIVSIAANTRLIIYRFCHILLARTTKALERTLVELRHKISITDIQSSVFEQAHVSN